jgi:hypothetical protein
MKVSRGLAKPYDRRGEMGEVVVEGEFRLGVGARTAAGRSFTDG